MIASVNYFFFFWRMITSVNNFFLFFVKNDNICKLLYQQSSMCCINQLVVKWHLTSFIWSLINCINILATATVEQHITYTIDYTYIFLGEPVSPLYTGFPGVRPCIRACVREYVLENLWRLKWPWQWKQKLSV